MTIVVTSAPDPTKPAISLTLLKAHLNILETDYDTVLPLYTASAVAEFEAITGRALINQTVRQTFDQFPCEDYFLLEKSPVVSDIAIQYYDEEEELQTLATSVYSVNRDQVCPRVQLKEGQVWPTIHGSRLSCVQITYQVGYGADDTFVPAPIKHILALIIGDSFVNREDSVVMPGIGSIVINWGARDMMKKYKANYYQHRSQNRTN